MELNVNKSRKLVFSISIANVDVTNVKGTFILYLNDSFIVGFSTIVESGKLVVTIPSLSKLNPSIKKKYKAELWVVANRDYFTIPWSEEIIFKKSINIKTSIKEEKDSELYVLVTKPIVKE